MSDAEGKKSGEEEATPRPQDTAYCFLASADSPESDEAFTKAWNAFVATVQADEGVESNESKEEANDETI